MLTAPPLTCYICHCHLCQKRTGSAFSLSIVVPADGLAITQGELRTGERPTGSGRVNRSHACDKCNSRIYTQADGARTLNLRAGTLDDASWIRPVAQFWTSSAQPWAVQPGILTYDGQADDHAKLLAAWELVASSASARMPAWPRPAPNNRRKERHG
nr:GFA family protein [Sphingomonas corticis]